MLSEAWAEAWKDNDGDEVWAKVEKMRANPDDYSLEDKVRLWREWNRAGAAARTESRRELLAEARRMTDAEKQRAWEKLTDGLEYRTWHDKATE